MKAFTFVMIFLTTTVQAQSYEWTSTIGGVGTEQVHAMVADDNGNIYICGSFKETADFDPSAAELNIASNGSSDVFIEKLNAAGELLWVKTFGSPSPDDAIDLKLDATGNVYVIGRFVKTVDFDPGAGVTSITSNGATDIFLEKLDTDGNFVWVKTWGSTSTDEGAALSIDNDGNIYTTGYFKNTIDFDLGPGTAELTATGSNKNVFLQKLNSNGNIVWAKAMTGSNCYPTAITTDNSGNVFFTGYFTGTVDFDPSDATILNKTSRGLNDIFTQKLDANGDLVWVSTIEGTSDNKPTDVAVAADGSVFVTGNFNGTADFDPSANAMDIPSTGLADGFLQKLDANGELMLVKRIGGAYADAVNGINITPDNTIWLTGYFSNSMIMDASHTMTSVGAEDIFVASYDIQGTLMSTISYGGALGDSGEKVLYSGTNLYAVGTFQSTPDFDIAIAVDEKSSNGLEDVFVQKLSFCVAADVPTVSASATTICAGETVNLEITSGNLNSAANWTWREGACTGNHVADGSTTTISPTTTTTYYVSGEGGCITSSTCQTIEITVLAAPTTTENVTLCYDANYTFPDGTVQENITTNLTYKSVFSAASGCDSTMFTNISVLPEINATITASGNTLSTAIQEATYQWINCETNGAISGATGATFTPTESGNYAVIITSPDGCVKTSNCESMSIVGTLAPAREKQFDVYPNPMTTVLNVAISTSYKEGSLALYHITGQQVYTQNLKGERQLELDVHDLTQGTYYLKITTDGVPAVTKIVK